jgi:hypothetical protein
MLYVCMHVWMYVCMYVFVCMHVCMCMYLCIYLCVYVCILTPPRIILSPHFGGTCCLHLGNNVCFRCILKWYERHRALCMGSFHLPITSAATWSKVLLITAAAHSAETSEQNYPLRVKTQCGFIGATPANLSDLSAQFTVHLDAVC